MTNFELIKRILQIVSEATGKTYTVESHVDFVKDRPGHDRRYAIDASKIKKELGFSVSVPFEKGLEETVKWYLAHRQWWERITTGEYLAYCEKWYGR